MTVLEEITQAIEQLEGIRSDCGDVIANELIPAVFFRADDDMDEDGNRFSYGIEVGTEEPEFAGSIETLFRTIDAQLAILKAARDDFEQYGGKPSKFFENDVALARAINGATS